jgi:hypothetical protein
MLHSCILWFSNFSSPRQQVGAAVRDSGLTRFDDRRHRSSRTCSTVRVKMPLNPVMSNDRFRLENKAFSLSGHLRDAIRHQHGIYLGKCSQRRPSLLFIWNRVLHSALIRLGDRWQRSGRHKFARRQRRKIEISRYHLWARYPFLHMSLDVYRHVPETLYRLEQRSFACTADCVHVERIIKKKPLMVSFSTGRGSGEENRCEPSVPVKGICRAIMRAFTRQRASP